MYQLASITYLDMDGNNARVQAARILQIVPQSHGGEAVSRIVLDNGSTINSKSSVASLITAQDAVWSDYLSALAGTAP